MKKVLFIILIAIAFFSCKEVPKDYFTISGLIEKNGAENIDIISRGFDKRINVDEYGVFNDTIKIKKQGYHTFNDGKNKTIVFIKNGDVLKMQYNYNNLHSTVVYSGVGFETTKYLNDRKHLDSVEGVNDLKAFFKLTPIEFTDKLKRIDTKLNKILVSDNIDSTLKSNEIKRNRKAVAYLKKNYAKEHGYYVKFAKGTKSPKFFNYESIDGKKVSLDDFKGKFVYIDVWATWCGPCKREIPHLKELEKQYKNKNIEFVSISVDNGRGYRNDKVAAKNAWKQMIKDKEMKGTQLYADKDWNSDFIKTFNIRSIPTFILIDDKGNIVNAKAPRPSNNSLKDLLNSVLK